MHWLFLPQIRLTCVLLWGLAWLVVAALLLLPPPLEPPGRSDLVAHFSLFCAMAFGAVSFCHGPRRLLGLTLLTMSAAAALECAQRLVPYRTFDLLDMAANVLGAGSGYFVALAALFLLIRPANPTLQAVRN
ncbi:MAG: VanZ family protein [Geminicoccaceae bacterium]